VGETTGWNTTGRDAAGAEAAGSGVPGSGVGSTSSGSTFSGSTPSGHTGRGGRAVVAPPDALSGVDLPTRMLVFGVAQLDGTIAAVDAFAVAEACGRSAEQVRSCLRRLVGEQLFVRDGVGQRATYRPTRAGLRELSAMGDRALRARAQDRERDRWDGRWRLVAFAVPEARRAARDALRDALGCLGAAPVHNGLFVSARPWEDDVAAAARELGIVEHVTQAATDRLIVGGESDPSTLAARLWKLDALAVRYRHFVDRWSCVSESLEGMRRDHTPLPDTAFLPGALAMALAYRACFESDPLLPAELLPRPWPGRAARDLLARTRRQALEIRAESGRPALFATYHDLVESAPEEA
jgi:phenylacetic acid degradation operon negative regulatory protein